MIYRLSLRYKVPISLSLAILLTGALIAAILIWRSYGEVRNQLVRNSIELGHVLSKTLIAPLKYDDVWQAYQILRFADAGVRTKGRVFILLDDQHRVYASNKPKEFPLASELRQISPEMVRLEDAIKTHNSRAPFLHEVQEDSRLFVVMPVIDDRVLVATLAIGYPRDIYKPHLVAVARSVGVSSLIAIFLLIPVAWYIAKSGTRPLTDLSRNMRQVGNIPLEEIKTTTLNREDEVGQLGRQFNKMIEELKNKQELERQVVVSERLAAIGRLAAGVAHEINNPLGGMMNAINTCRRFGRPDPVTDKTIGLVARGLDHVKQTVSALLVEARSESHELTPQDIEDVRTLVQAGAQEKGLRLVWSNELSGPVSLPATPIRQVLMNLSLNAMQAASQQGCVQLYVSQNNGILEIQVRNDGVTISNEEIERLFEPFVHNNPQGTGLGLWVTYQIVQQFRGEISVLSERGNTQFTVRLPLDLAA